jgi:hypothetical protein
MTLEGLDPAARAFVENGGDPPVLGGDAARALVAVLVERRDAERLAILAQRGARDLAKEARRGIHLLRTKGVAAEAPRKAAPAPAPIAAAEPDEAYGSSPDGKGDRLVSVLRLSHDGGFDQIHVTISDETGLVEIVTGRGPKKAFRNLKRRFEQSHLVFAELPFDHALALVQEAYEKTVALGRAVPPGYAAARGSLEGGPGSAARLPHPALAIAPATQLGATDAAALHELPDLLSWVPDREVLRQLSMRLDEVATSQLMVDEGQRAAARVAAIDRAIESSFEAAGRAAWRRRLLDAALVYGAAGHEDDAARLRAQADRLGAADFRPVEDPFARALVEKVLPPELRPDRSAPGLIVTPP